MDRSAAKTWAFLIFLKYNYLPGLATRASKVKSLQPKDMGFLFTFVLMDAVITPAMG
jgi:hypothetical protein